MYIATTVFMVVPPCLKSCPLHQPYASLFPNTEVESLETHARQAGMRTLFENGCLAVEQGLTTFEELIRVLGMPHGK
nr:hypothetical protein [Shigella flexneri]